MEIQASGGLYDGIIYIMHTRSTDGVVIPGYIGKAETLGKAPGRLSANLERLETNTRFFGRWGDNYAYHIGDLSAVVLPGHEITRQIAKYRSWANALFETSPTDRPRLRQPVFFWVKAWKKDDVGIWQEFGPTRLSFLEYLLIGLASAIFPNQILNREGHNRGKTVLPTSPDGSSSYGVFRQSLLTLFDFFWAPILRLRDVLRERKGGVTKDRLFQLETAPVNLRVLVGIQQDEIPEAVGMGL